MSFNIILFSSGMQAPPAEVHVVVEAPSEVEEGMCTHLFQLTSTKLQLIWH